MSKENKYNIVFERNGISYELKYINGIKKLCFVSMKNLLNEYYKEKK